MKLSFNSKKMVKVFCHLAMFGTFFYSVFALAQGPVAGPGGGGGGGSIGDLATNIVGSFTSIGSLLIATAYIAGFILIIASIFKFKQHKDNPTQIPMGTPVALLIIGAVLVFLPSIIGPAGVTIFGQGKATYGGATGTSFQQIEQSK
jgi:intracellular multiplication protein IcmD